MCALLLKMLNFERALKRAPIFADEAHTPQLVCVLKYELHVYGALNTFTRPGIYAVHK